MLQPFQRLPDPAVFQPKFIVYRDGSNFYAKNGRTGQESSFPDARSAIQYAINNAVRGYVFLTEDEFSLQGKILMNSYVSIKGSGFQSTRLVPEGNFPVFEFPSGTSNIKIEDLMIEDQQSKSSSPTSAIFFDINSTAGGQFFATLRDILVRKYSGVIGFSTADPGNYYSYGCFFEHIIGDQLRGTSYHFRNLRDSHLRYLEADYRLQATSAKAYHFNQGVHGIEGFDLRAGGFSPNLYDYGYFFEQGVGYDGRIELHNINSDDPLLDGAYFAGNNEVTVLGGNFALWNGKGFYIKGCQRVQVKNVDFFDNSNGPCVVLENSSGCLIDGNHLKSPNPGVYGIEETGSSDYNIVANNYMRGSRGIHCPGSNTKQCCNIP